MNFKYIMKTLLLVALLSCGLNSNAQLYKPMLAQFNEWHVTNCYFGCLTDVYYTDANILVNGYSYAVLDGFHYSSRSFLLREDTIERQVFLLFTGIADDSEYLLYDFSLQPGDSMLIYNPISPLPDSAGYFKVDSIVPEVMIDGDTYRHFYLKSLDSLQSGSSKTEWIEGIGSLSLINTPGGNPNLNGIGALSCFFNNQTLHYSNLDSINDCMQEYPNLSQDNIFIKLNKNVNIFPNPAKDRLSINSSGDAVSKVKIYDMLGKELLTSNFNGHNIDLEMDISVLLNGSFIVQIEMESGTFYTKKLIVSQY